MKSTDVETAEIERDNSRTVVPDVRQPQSSE